MSTLLAATRALRARQQQLPLAAPAPAAPSSAEVLSGQPPEPTLVEAPPAAEEVAPAEERMSDAEKNNINTPPDLCELIRKFGGGKIGLDPCANPYGFVRATTEWTEGALERSWHGHGLVYANPPYGRGLLRRFTSKIREEFAGALVGKDECLLLCPARTDTGYWHEDVTTADAVLFFRGRPRFWYRGVALPGGGKFPSAMAFWGSAERVKAFLDTFGATGWAVACPRAQEIAA